MGEELGVDFNEIIGVDPGLSRCGAACIHTENGKLLRHIIVTGTSTTRDPLSYRVFGIYHRMFKFLGQTPGKKLVAVEGPAFYKASRSMEAMSRCRQAVYDMAAFFFEDFLWMEISPATVKSRVTGSGKAAKEVVSSSVWKVCGGDLRTYETHGYTIGDSAAVALAAKVGYEETRRKADNIYGAL